MAYFENEKADNIDATKNNRKCMNALRDSTQTPKYSPTRTREASNQNAEVVLKLMRRSPRVFEVLWRSGLRVTEHWHPSQKSRVSFRLEQPHWTERQSQIANLLRWLKLCTAYDLVRALGLDANNRGVLGQIGQDCEAIHAYSRQVTRLVGSERCRVYSFDKLYELTLSEIRAIYRWQSSTLDWVSTPSKTQKVAVRLP
jgi:hypothetical protein